jgi:hypothetical protein
VLIGELSHADHNVRSHAAVQLGTMGDVNTTDALTQALGTESEFFVREYHLSSRAHERCRGTAAPSLAEGRESARAP